MLLDDKDLDVVTIRAEMSRLRRVIGAEFIDSRPYRLLSPIASDMGDVFDALASRRRRPRAHAIHRRAASAVGVAGHRAAAHRAQRERARRGSRVGKPWAASPLARPSRRPRRPSRLAGAVQPRRAGFGHACTGPRPSRRPGFRPGLAPPTVATSCNRAATVRNLPSVTSDTFTSRRQEKRHDRVRPTGCRGLADVLPAPIRELHRRGVGRARGRPILRERQPGQRSAVLRDPPLR